MLKYWNSKGQAVTPMCDPKGVTTLRASTLQRLIQADGSTCSWPRSMEPDLVATGVTCLDAIPQALFPEDVLSGTLSVELPAPKHSSRSMPPDCYSG